MARLTVEVWCAFPWWNRPAIAAMIVVAHLLPTPFRPSYFAAVARWYPHFLLRHSKIRAT